MIEAISNLESIRSLEAKKAYRKLEAGMIMCITREMECTPERCATCGWLRDEIREYNAILLKISKRVQSDYLEVKE